MAKSGASASAKAFTGVPVAPRGQNRSFKKSAPKTKFKMARPEEPDDTLERLRFLKQKKEQVKAAMLLEGKSQQEIDAEMRKIDNELQRKQKPKPEDAPETNDGGSESSSEPDAPEEQILPKVALLPRSPKNNKGLQQTFWNANARGLRVPPLSADQGFERRKPELVRKPSILFMQNARKPLKAANNSKAPARSGMTSSSISGGKSGGPSSGASGGPAGGGGGPR